MTAAKRDLYIEQGATWRLSLVWSARNEDGTVGDPISLLGFSARMQIRKTQQATPAVSLTSAPGGGITLGGLDGTIDILITDDQTDLLTPRNALYDLELEGPNDDVYRILQGKVTIDPNITQESDDPPLEG